MLAWRPNFLALLTLLVWLPSAIQSVAFRATDPRYYDLGAYTVTEVWVDPVNGDDGRTGATRGAALKTLTEAWNRIPLSVTLSTTGYRIMLTPGTYPEDALPNYLEYRWGTAQFPIIFQAADGPGTVTLGGDLNVFGTRYLYLLDLRLIPNPPGDVFHCELCDHILIRNSVLKGGVFDPSSTDPVAHETVKINQSQYIFLEDNDIAGADDNAVDFVAVQYGHLQGNRIHNAQDWCAYVKGGSAYLRVEANEIFDCGVGGFTAGQGAGMQFMQTPWLHYEAYDVRVINNFIHDVNGAGLGVNGGYDILLAHNTLYRVGAADHLVEFVFGARSCDGQMNDPGRERCAEYLGLGGWGTTVVDDGVNFVRIPNRNIFFYNNLIYNPAGYQSQWQHFTIFGPYSGTTQIDSNVLVPTLADQNVQIRGNIIWNGPADHPLGIEDTSAGCQDSNPTCNAAQLRANNYLNTLEPQLVDPAAGNFQPLQGGNLLTATTYALPAFPVWDGFTPTVPAGTLTTTVTYDRLGNVRVGRIPGAWGVALPAPTAHLYLPLLMR